MELSRHMNKCNRTLFSGAVMHGEASNGFKIAHRVDTGAGLDQWYSAGLRAG
jgi:hypothetical protein